MNVKELREKTGLTQAELSEKTGIPRDRIAKWEQGKGSPKSEDERILTRLFGKFKWEDVPRESMLNEDQAAYYSGPVDLGKEFGKLKEWQIMVDATLEVLIAELVPLIAKAAGKSNAGVFSQMQKDIAVSVEQKMVLPKKKK